jgi:hypothetical protein
VSSSSSTARSSLNSTATWRLVAVGVTLGGIEDAADGAHILRPDAEHLLEGIDLGTTDGAIDLGHLGTEHNYGNAEDHLLGGAARVRSAQPRWPVCRRGKLERVVGMAGGGAQNSAERPAHRKAGHAADDLAPDAHPILTAAGAFRPSCPRLQVLRAVAAAAAKRSRQVQEAAPARNDQGPCVSAGPEAR